eukprot:CCRYP_005825-RA/>CCRYP_005825-RA protein AED:0.68 eAED:1.00 QI:0/-1/0/1/-1/1/1/0/110
MLQTTPTLLQNTVNLILILQLQHFRRVVWADAFAVKEEADGAGLDSLARGVGIEDFGHLRVSFHFEEEFLSILEGWGRGLRVSLRMEGLHAPPVVATGQQIDHATLTAND